MEGVSGGILLRSRGKQTSYSDSFPTAGLAGKSLKNTSLSFTYFPKSQSFISAVKLTERDIAQRDVLTIYYPPGKIYFTFEQCQAVLGYDSKRIISIDHQDHTAELHKPENPTRYNHMIDGWHCHIKVNRAETTDFLGRVFIRHKVDTDSNRLHLNQFLYSMSALRKTPDLSGLIFKDGSITQNAECTDMEESHPLKRDGFKQV